QAAAWLISQYLPNGYFLAHRAEADARHDGEHTQLQVHGWTAVPEAVPDILRQWTIPADRPITVDWHVEVPRPRRRLPEGGYLPDHRGNQPGHTQSAEISRRRAWETPPAEDLEAFAEAVAQYRDRWPADHIAEVLEKAAQRLNADEPLAPHLGSLINGG